MSFSDDSEIGNPEHRLASPPIDTPAEPRLAEDDATLTSFVNDLIVCPSLDEEDLAEGDQEGDPEGVPGEESGGPRSGRVQIQKRLNVISEAIGMEKGEAAASSSESWEMGDSAFTVGDIPKLQAFSTDPSKVEIVVPKKGQRPWDAPDGFMCLLESHFTQANLLFPIPNALVEFCNRKNLMFCQLSPVVIANMVALMHIAHSCNSCLTGWKFEASCGLVQIKDRMTQLPTATYYTSCGAIRPANKFDSWRTKYFFVRKNSFTIFNKDADFIKQWNHTPVPSGKLSCPPFDAEYAVWRTKMPVPPGALTPDALRNLWVAYGDTFWDVSIPMPFSSPTPEGVGERALKPPHPKRSKVGTSHLPPTSGSSSKQVKAPGKRTREEVAIHPPTVSIEQAPVGASGSFPPFEFSYKGGKRLQEDDAACEELWVKLGGIEESYPPPDERCFSDAASLFGRHVAREARLTAYLANGFERFVRERNEEIRELGARLKDVEEKREAELTEIRRRGREKLQKAKACVEGFKAAFRASVEHQRTESVAISLRHYFDKGEMIDQETVEHYETESKRLRDLAGAVEVKELDPTDFSL